MIWVVFLGACSALRPITCDVGEGPDSFVPLEDGMAVSIIQGPQGGFHLWTSMRESDPGLERAEVTISGLVISTMQPIGPGTKAQVALLPDSAGGRSVYGLRDFIDAPDAVRGQLVRVQAQLKAADGRTCAAEHTVLPQ